MPFFTIFIAYGFKLVRWCKHHTRNPRSRRPRVPPLPSQLRSQSGLSLTSQEPLKETYSRAGSTQTTIAPGGPERNESTLAQPSVVSHTPPPPPNRSTPNQGTPKRIPFETANPSFLGEVEEVQGRPAYGGGFSNVSRCRVYFSKRSEGLPTEVAVKVLRATHLSQPEAEQGLEPRFWQELITWLRLPRHPNIVPLLGWTLEPSLSFICPWYSRGSLRPHLKNLSDAQRLHILLGVARALECLHSCKPPIFHGDIKPDNILLSDSGEPLLADFGLSTIQGEEAMYTLSHHVGGALPWMSPESMVHGLKSCESDIYSFGILAFTVLTGELPYAGLREYSIISRACDENNRNGPVDNWSTYPQLQGQIQDLLLGCWSLSPKDRLRMSVIVQRLTTLLESPNPESHPHSL